MNKDQRRQEIVLYLMASKKPVSGTTLSEKFNVSRQIIVQDIALLKTTGHDIISTHNGYILQKMPYCERIIKVLHTKDQTEDELMTIINLGGIVADVFVWHKAYGKITAPLNMYNKLHVEEFMEQIRSGKSRELMDITGGYHYHTIRATTEQVLDLIEQELTNKNYLMKCD